MSKTMTIGTRNFEDIMTISREMGYPDHWISDTTASWELGDITDFAITVRLRQFKYMGVDCDVHIFDGENPEEIYDFVDGSCRKRVA